MRNVNATTSLRLTPLAACMAAALSFSAAAATSTNASRPGALAGGARADYSAALDQGHAHFLSPALAKTLSSLLHPPSPTATTRTVTNCNDGPAGTVPNGLRDTVAASADGDTVNFTLSCSKITLTAGAINVFVPGLIISGPGAAALTIDGGFSSTPRAYNEVFYHSGTGTLGISGLTIADAKYQSATVPSGGCIYSKGSVTLSNSTVTGCFVQGTGTVAAAGAGIYAKLGVNVKYSTVSNNVADNASTGPARGGGIYTKGSLFTKYSTISNNFVLHGSTSLGEGGGIYSSGAGNVTILGTTISNNYAQLFGGLQIKNGGAFTASITNSTISGNTAASSIGGAGVYLPLTLSNTTIASNKSTATSGFGAGLFLGNGTASDFESSLLALNADGTNESDVSVGSGSTITGANNLITVTTAGVPLGTISACPKLAPLADNGGAVFSMALLQGSPAINTGNNNAALTKDTRGFGFARVVGPFADIGSYERQTGVVDDMIFANGFESGCIQ